MTESQKEVEQYQRGMLARRLEACTPSQKDLFNKIYPDGVPLDKLMNAIDLCDRTIRKNATKL